MRYDISDAEEAGYVNGWQAATRPRRAKYFILGFACGIPILRITDYILAVLGWS